MISNKVCVMIGRADDGVFACSAKEMAKNGYVVAMISDKSEAVIGVADEICTFGGLAKAYYADISSYETVSDAHALILSEFGKCRNLVSFLGKCESGIDEIMGVTDMFISDMVSEAEGSVVHMCQMTEANDNSENNITDITKKMAVTLAESGVRVNAIVYGEMENEMRDLQEDDISSDASKESIPMKRLARPTDTVGALTYLSDSNSACYTTGNVIYVDGGVYAARGRQEK